MLRQKIKETWTMRLEIKELRIKSKITSGITAYKPIYQKALVTNLLTGQFSLNATKPKHCSNICRSHSGESKLLSIHQDQSFFAQHSPILKYHHGGI